MKIKYQDLKHEDPNQDIYIDGNDVIIELKDRNITLRNVHISDMFYAPKQPDWDIIIPSNNA